MPHLSPQSTLPAVVAAALACFSGTIAAQEAPTTSFEPAAPLRDRDGAALSVPGHAAVRAVDWDQDGDLYLLVGGGDGQVWLLENRPTKGDSGMALDPPRALRAGARERWGTSYTGAYLADVTGDRLPDLLVAHSGEQLTIHENRGARGAPSPWQPAGGGKGHSPGRRRRSGLAQQGRCKSDPGPRPVRQLLGLRHGRQH